jgi:DNA invertase Pin-like site-specific DNA recombinase
MTALGYIRISTGQQTLDQQREALVATGIDPQHVYEDTISGVRTKRPGLDALLAYACEGDTVTVVRLDRLGRSLAHIVTTISELREREILVRSLTEGIDMSTASGKAMALMFMLMAEYERDLLRERLQEARASHEARGGRWGRPTVLTGSKAEDARRMWSAGVSIVTIADTLKISRTTAYRATADLRIVEPDA